MCDNGIRLSTPAILRSRLDARVAAGELTRATSDAFYAASAFHADRLESRPDKFWMISHPLPVDDPGVEALLAYWGGEVVSMRLTDPNHLALLRSLGKPRVIELAVPLALTRQARSAGEAVISTFARTLACTSPRQVFDAYVTAPLCGKVLLAVHSDQEADFSKLGREYPCGYVG